MNTCQNVDCNNVGIPVKVEMIMEKTNKKEIHDIYLCRPCISIQNYMGGGFKN
jgi:hypothetical protein